MPDMTFLFFTLLLLLALRCLLPLLFVKSLLAAGLLVLVRGLGARLTYQARMSNVSFTLTACLPLAILFQSLREV